MPTERLNRERVLAAAVSLADADGGEVPSMRRLAQELGVVPMALYKHVADKEELLGGMVDVVLGELPPLTGSGWRATVRQRVLDARRLQLRHRWLRRVLETQATRTPVVLARTDELIGVFRSAGFSDQLTHHVMHAFGSRMWGFTQELFESPVPAAEPTPEQVAQLAAAFPDLAAVAVASGHDPATVVGPGCDDQFEFEFALDLMLDGFARLHEAGWPADGRLSG